MKELFDEQVIDTAFKKIIESKSENIWIHLVYAGYYYSNSEYFMEFNQEKRLNSFILKAIEKYNLKKVMVTQLNMWRKRLITKEQMENFYKGKDKYTGRKISLNDDLESLFEDIQLGREPDDFVNTYFLPKLTEQELKLVERKDYNFMHTFEWMMNSDVKKTEMAASESDSKFLEGRGKRKTYTIKHTLKRKFPTSFFI